MMNKRKSMIGLLLIVAVLFIGIGYAAISSVTLTITGNAKVEPGADAFNVNYTYDSTTPANNKIVGAASTGFTITAANTYAEYTALRTAVISATEFTEQGQYVDFTFTVKNESSHLNATLTNSDISLPSGNTYFTVTLPSTVNLNLAPNGTGTFTVRVTCVKTPTEVQTWNSWVVTITPQPSEASS